jgi:hypothetical protein
MAKATRAASTKASTTKAATAKANSDTTVSRTEPEGAHTDLATPNEEAKMRKAATSDAARKAALDAGKKDPLEKWGDPAAAPDSVRRAAFGG